MTRSRRPEDWGRDLAAARPVEEELASILGASPLVKEFQDHTASFDRLDFSFLWKGQRVWLDVKEKRQRYSKGITSQFPECDPADLFMIDETVYRRIVWQGGGGYLALHDIPSHRWVFFGPWELTLGSKQRINRWIDKGSGRQRKGKILLDMSCADVTDTAFTVEAVGRLVDSSRAAREQLAGVVLGRPLPEIGGQSPVRRRDP